jgi:hypothetical protein
MLEMESSKKGQGQPESAKSEDKVKRKHGEVFL